MRPWTDGLPVIAPRRELVDELVRASHRAADELIGEVPPLGGRATIEKVAANCVMAGCKPEYMPVVVTAIEAMLEGGFNLNGMQCSTHMATPMVVVHGPIRQELDINCGNNVFGQSWRANALDDHECDERARWPCRRDRRDSAGALRDPEVGDEAQRRGPALR